jgi:tetratricopeptide (TPR) repeat protein
MTTASPRPGRPTARAPARRRFFLAASLIGILALAGVIVGLVWHAVTTPRPPTLDLTGFDPEAAAAVGDAQAAVGRQPRSAAAWGHLGMVLFAHDVYAQAGQCFARAEQLEPSDVRWPYFQGLIILLGDPPAALPHLERAAALGGSQPAARLRLAEALLTQDRLDEAAGQFEQLLREQPDNPRVQLGIGQILYRRGELRASLPYLTRAAASDLARRSAGVLLVEVYRRLGDRQAAERESARLAGVPADPSWPDPLIAEAEELQTGVEARIARAERLLQAGHGSEAFALLQQTIRTHPEADRAYLVLGRVALAEKELGLSEQALRQAVRQAPDAVVPRFLLGCSLFLQEKVPEAASEFRRALRIKPDYAEAHFNLAQCLQKQGEPAAAVEECRTALRFKPNLVEVHRLLSELLIARGQDGEAFAHVEDALSLAPGDPRLRRLQAEIIARQAAPILR